MRQLGTPVTFRWGSRDPEAPLIVLLHRRGSTEKDMAWLVPYWCRRAGRRCGRSESRQVIRSPPLPPPSWIEARLGYLQQRYVQQHDAVAAAPARWPIFTDGMLPARQGAAPEVSVTTPQQQESQNAPVALQETDRGHGHDLRTA